MMALDAAIKGLAYSEVLFGPFSEISLQGNVQLGEIYKRLGDIPRAIEYYRAFVFLPSFIPSFLPSLLPNALSLC